MSQLHTQACEACRADAPRLSRDEAETMLKEVPQWALVEKEGIPRLWRRFSFKDFAGALAFTCRVGDLAEEQDHHPEIITRWGEVEVTWWSHKIKGLHRNDFICAARCDRLLD